jgi:regulatory protein
MKITKIVQQEKQKDRYSVFVDGKYSFSLSQGALLESKLANGQELDKDALKQWKQISADDKVYSQSLRYAAMRLRSAWEMEQYLHRKNASPALAEKILNKLSNIELLNDEAFARAWVANRRLLRPTSKRKLQQELRAKRVADEVIEAVLNEEATSDDLAALREIIAKKRNLPKYKADPLKLMNYLARQGFSYGDIKDILGSSDD